MDKNNTYLAIGGTAVVAVLVIVGMVLASGYAGTLTGMAAGTQTSLDSVSGRLNALKTETDQLNATASLNLIRTEAIIPALNEAAGDLSDEIASGNTNLQNSIDSVNSSIVNELNSVNNDLSGSLDAVNSSLYNQMNTANANITNQLNLINTGLSNQLTTVYNNLHSELSLAYSGIISSVNAMNTNMNAQFGNLNANLSAVNASIISAITANNASIIDQLAAMNMSLQDALALLQGNVTDLEQKLWSLDDSVKNDTKLIQGLIENITYMNSTIQSELDHLDYQTSRAPQILTKSGTFTLLNQTTVPDGEEYIFIHIADVSIIGDGAADFRATAFVWIDNASRDISDADDDYFMILKGVGAPEVTTTEIAAADGDIGMEWFEIEFTGHYMTIYFVLRGTVQEDITVYYSYTVTTSNDAFIYNSNPDPPVP